jgi:hypothetical protein
MRNDNGEEKERCRAGDGRDEKQEIDGDAAEGNCQRGGEKAVGRSGCVYFVETDDGAFVSRTQVIWAILTFLAMPAWMLVTSTHEQPAASVHAQPAAEKPFYLSAAAEKRVTDLRRQAHVIYDRIDLKDADAFMRESAEAEKLDAEADDIESAEIDKWLGAAGGAVKEQR